MTLEPRGRTLRSSGALTLVSLLPSTVVSEITLQGQTRTPFFSSGVKIKEWKPESEGPGPRKLS